MRLGNKALSIILCLIMAFASVTVGGDGFTDFIKILSTKVHAINSEFAGGTGTADDPYMISTLEQLNSIRNHLDSSFALANDIDLSEISNWEPIGEKNTQYGYSGLEEGPTGNDIPFEGTLDGRGYAINALTISNQSISFFKDSFGLFANLSGAVVKNIELTNTDIFIDKETTDYKEIYKEYKTTYRIICGGLAGWCDNSTIENVYISGNIKMINCNNVDAGGIIGICGTNTSIVNCVSDTNIEIIADKDSRFINDGHISCGGIAGNGGKKISMCTNIGNIDVSGGASVGVGGIVGVLGYIDNCVNFGTIRGYVKESPELMSSGVGVGGIIAGNPIQVVCCVNYGSVYSKNDYHHWDPNSRAGGIAGSLSSYNSKIIDNCFNISKEIESKTLDDKNNTVDCEAGRITSTPFSSIVTNCFSIETTKVNGSIVNSEANNQNGVSLSQNELMLEQTYTGFDFNNVWMIKKSYGAILKNYDIALMNHSDSSAPFWGDLNGDYKNDFADLLVYNKIRLGTIAPTPEQRCFMDVNLNGEINDVVDAQSVSDGDKQDLIEMESLKDQIPQDMLYMNMLRLARIDSLPAESLADYKFVPPTKTTYAVGEAFDSSGMKIIVTNKDNPSVRYELTENIEVPDFDLSSEGSKTVTASFRGLNYTFNVNIINADVDEDEDEEIIIRGKFEGYYTATSQSNTGKKYASPVIIDGIEYPTQEMLISLSKADGYKGKKVAILVKGGKIIDIIEDVYDLKDETYRFKNFGYDTNKDSFCKPKHNHGHCFGMAVTSSAYYLGLLNRTDIIGGKDYEPLYSFLCSQGVREPICHYQCIQGKTVKNAMVAGGYVDKHLNGVLINPSGDWRACVDYVKNHNYDNEGSLTVGVWFDYEDRGIVEGTWVDVINYSAHELNFLYYKEVDGQQRIYVYDSNAPEYEQYLYWGEDNRIHEKRFYIENNEKTDDDHIIVGMDLMDVKKYFDEAEKFKSSNTVYGDVSEISVSNSEVGFLRGEQESGGYVMFEVPDGTKEVVITPLVDYAEFEYMDKTYTFGKIDDNTYGVLTLATSDSAPENVEFEIKDAPNSSLTEAIIYVKSDEVYKNSKVSVKAKAAGVPDGYVLAVYDGGKPVATGTNTFVTYEIPNLVVSDKKLEVKIIDKDGNVQKDKNGKDLSENIEIKVKPGFFNMIIAFFKKLFGSNKVTIEP